MNIQSFSIVVPNKECMNKCPFCVSRMVNSNAYPNLMDPSHKHYDINVQEYLKRMRYVSNAGCQTVMLTGTSEPQQNRQFLTQWAMLHKLIGSPFTNIEMQTTGVLLEDRNYLRLLRNFVGVNTIALSINALEDDENNKILGHDDGLAFVHLGLLCNLIQEYDFNIRCCYNLNDSFNDYEISEVFEHAKMLGASQVTFRKLYSSGAETPQGKWIEEHDVSMFFRYNLHKFLEEKPVIGCTIYGNHIREVDRMSVIYDEDCMGKDPKNAALKYLILRPNCKLYSSWDNKASLVF